MRSLGLMLCSWLLLGTAPAWAGVDVRADPAADFSKYSTYEIVESNTAQSPELRQYLVKGIEQQLQKAGWRRVADNGDLAVEIGVSTSFGGGVTGNYVNSVTWNFAILSADVYQFTDGTLVVTIVDAAASRGIWQGVATKTFTDSDYGVIRKQIDKITSKMFHDFPPHRPRTDRR